MIHSSAVAVATSSSSSVLVQATAVQVVASPAADDTNTPSSTSNTTGSFSTHTQSSAKVSMQIGFGSDVDEDNIPFVKGEPQPDHYRDAWASVLFPIQCGFVLGVAIVYFPYIVPQDDNSDYMSNGAGAEGTDKSGGLDFLLLVLVSYAMAARLTIVSLILIMQYSVNLVEVSFLIVPLCLFVAFLATLPFHAADDNVAYILFGGLALAWTVINVITWHTYRRQIPFAAAN